MIENSRLKQLLLFTLLSLITYGLYEKYFNDSKINKYQPFTKGYSLTGVTIKSTDENGKIITTIESPAVIFYADTEQTIIEKPLIRLHEDDGNWVFKSQSGEINPNKTEIFFPDQVNVVLESKESDGVTINTSALTVDVTHKTGTTEAPLTMQEPGTLFKGKGAQFNFNQQEIEILSEMYAEFKN